MGASRCWGTNSAGELVRGAAELMLVTHCFGEDFRVDDHAVVWVRDDRVESLGKGVRFAQPPHCLHEAIFRFYLIHQARMRELLQRACRVGNPVFLLSSDPFMVHTCGSVQASKMSSAQGMAAVA